MLRSRPKDFRIKWLRGSLIRWICGELGMCRVRRNDFYDSDLFFTLFPFFIKPN